MESMLTIILHNLVAAIAFMFVAWLLSLAKKDASVADIFWGLGFVLIAWITFIRTDGFLPRSLLITALTTVWGFRLAIHICVRDWGKGEDRRYRAWREDYGPRFWWVSLFTVFGLQGFLLWIVSLVVQVGQIQALPEKFVLLDGIGTLIWVVGFFFEALGDWQLLRFKSNPENKGKVMKSGLWAYTRHPNYFGESLMWWGIFLIVLSTPGSLWVILSPIVITFLLLKVSGVTLLEKSIVETRPKYKDYIESTNAFIPWFPRKEKP